MRSYIVWAVTEVNMGMYEIVQRHLKGVLGEVSESEREVLVMRFGLDGNGSHTMDEVGERFGLSHEEIRKIEEKALGLTSIGNFEVLQKNLRCVLDQLEPTEQEVLVMRYGLDGNGSHSMEDVADALGLTRKEVRIMEVKALRLLREKH
ncbi:MAG: hypothetical protein IIT57_03630 [Treponema sp.]|nr:hypothetical protein [Treponema sp.]